MARTLARRRTPAAAQWFTVIERGAPAGGATTPLYGQVHAAAAGSPVTMCGIELCGPTVRSSLPAVDFRVILDAAATTVCSDCRRAVRLASAQAAASGDASATPAAPEVA